MRKFPLLAALALLLAGAGCSLSGDASAPPKPVTLEYWRVQDDVDAMADQIAAYKKLHPNVDIVYRKMREEGYETLLLEAFAEGRGPDLFSVPNTWMGAWRGKLSPVPKEISVATQTVNAQQKIVTVQQKRPGLTVLEMRNRYVEGISKDLIVPTSDAPDKPPTDKIWGLPLSADSPALFYNRALLRKAGIETPATTWRDLQLQVVAMTVRGPGAAGHPETIIQSGAALGGSKNVRYSTDILAAIMQQNGAMLADEASGAATFAEYTPETRNKTLPPGVEALTFYQSFALPYAQNYSWNATMPDSLDAFVTGRTAFFIGLPSDIANVRDRAPSLDFSVAPLPQVDPTRPSNILHYPVEVVAKQSAHQNEAWDFLHFLSGEEQVRPFLAAAKRPAALRGLVGGQLTDADIAPFAGQVLTARAWYRGKDYAKAEEAFAVMIDFRPTTERPSLLPAVAAAADAVNATLR